MPGAAHPAKQHAGGMRNVLHRRGTKANRSAAMQTACNTNKVVTVSMRLTHREAQILQGFAMAQGKSKSWILRKLILTYLDDTTGHLIGEHDMGDPE